MKLCMFSSIYYLASNIEGLDIGFLKKKSNNNNIWKLVTRLITG
jgi:hypothetical protein